MGFLVKTRKKIRQEGHEDLVRVMLLGEEAYRSIYQKRC